jgi:hypothetical protein
MRRNSENLAITEVLSPTLGVNTRVPTNLPDRQSKRALQQGENIRCMDGALQSAPGLGNLPITPSLSGAPNAIHNGNITSENGFNVTQVPVIATNERIYSVTKQDDGTPPIVFAGEDAVIYNSNIYFLLDASVTDPEGLSYTLQWTVISKPGSATVWGNFNILDPIITVNEEGIYTFRLTATNSKGISTWDEMTIFFKAQDPIIYTPHIPIINDFFQPACDQTVQVTIQPEAYAAFSVSQTVRYLGSAYRVESKDGDNQVTLYRLCDQDPGVFDNPNTIPGEGPGPDAAPPGTNIGGGGTGTGYDDAPINDVPAGNPASGGGGTTTQVNWPTNGANYGDRGAREVDPNFRVSPRRPPSYRDVKAGLSEVQINDLFVVRNNTVSAGVTLNSTDNWTNALQNISSGRFSIFAVPKVWIFDFGYLTLLPGGVAEMRSGGVVGTARLSGNWSIGGGSITATLTTSTAPEYDYLLGTYVYSTIEHQARVQMSSSPSGSNAYTSVTDVSPSGFDFFNKAPYWQAPPGFSITTTPSAWEPYITQFTAGQINASALDGIAFTAFSITLNPYKTTASVVVIRDRTGPNPNSVTLFNGANPGQFLSSGTFTGDIEGHRMALTSSPSLTTGVVGEMVVDVRGGFNTGYFTTGCKVVLHGRYSWMANTYQFPLSGSASMYFLVEPPNNNDPSLTPQQKQPVVQPGQVIKVKKAPTNVKTSEYLTLVPIVASRSPLSYQAKSMLPSGLQLIKGSGYLWGWCTANAGAYAFEMSATNEFGEGATETVTVIVQDALPTVSAGSTTFTVGSAGSFQIVANNDPEWFKASGPVPPGLAVSRSGLLSGIPTTAGTYSFDVIAKNAVGQSTPTSISVTVNP